MRQRLVYLIFALLFLYLASANMGYNGARLLSDCDDTANRGGGWRFVDMGFYHQNASGVLSENGNNTKTLSQIATVYANITPDFYTIAIYNNTRLIHKGHVWVVAHMNITVNGHRLNATSIKLFHPSPSRLSIVYDDVIFNINLLQVSSLREVDELRDEFDQANLTELDAFGIMKYAVTGIPAFVVALGCSLAIIAFKKESHVQEGLKGEI